MSELTSRLGRSVMAAFLATTYALLFLKYIGWAATYSGALGVRSRAALAELGHERAVAFFVMFLTFEILTTWVMASLIQLEGIASDNFRIVARYVVALAFSLFATGILVWLISTIGSAPDRG
jgi:hypothetical protein